MQSAIDLTRFYNPNELRFSIREPFSDEKYTYATDGHIIIRVQRIPEITAAGGTTLPQWETLPWDHAELMDWRPVPSEIPDGRRVDCKACEGTGKVITCQDCAGGGEVEYNYDSMSGKTYYADLECPVCDGRGKMNGDGEHCEECAGEGYHIDPIAVKVADIGLYVSNHLLSLIKDLPGVQIATKGPARPDDLPPIRFRFDGGDGLLMPMREPSNYA